MFAIRALNPMRAFLNKMPQPRQLWEPYASLYSRYTADDSENQVFATTALEILVFADGLRVRWNLAGR